MHTLTPYRRCQFVALAVVGALLASMPFASDRGRAADGPDQKVPAKKDQPSPKLSYNRDIRPILVENCFACHGPDSASRKKGLRLDQRELAIKAGAIAPGKPEHSEMVQRIFGGPSERMPPKSSAKKLTENQKEMLRRWVAEGAEYQPHWSYIAPVRAELPKVKKEGWVRNPIDNFVLAKLEEKGLQPSTEADKRTLARRLSFDLTGLPPDPAEVEAFVKDTDPNAYEKLVDRWLEVPQYGEHRARYWLDAARYADTHGLHFDNAREMWAYRDWVIGAFNRNLSFDQFTIEQLAGDLLPNPKLDQLIASGFHRCNITTNEGGSIAEEVLVMYAKDRVETTGTVWLGLTAGCSSCHDHKFDSIPTKEFYQFAAFFRNTTQPAMDGNVPGSTPVVQVPGPGDSARWFELLKLTGDLRVDLERRRREGESKVGDWVKNGGGAKPIEPVEPKDQVLFLPAPKLTKVSMEQRKKLEELHAKYDRVLAEKEREHAKLRELAKIRKENKALTIERDELLSLQLKDLQLQKLLAEDELKMFDPASRRRESERSFEDFISLAKEELEALRKSLEQEKDDGKLKAAKSKLDSLSRAIATGRETLEKIKSGEIEPFDPNAKLTKEEQLTKQAELREVIKKTEVAVAKKQAEIQLDIKADGLEFLKHELALSKDLLKKIEGVLHEGWVAAESGKDELPVRIEGDYRLTKLPNGVKWKGQGAGNEPLQFENDKALDIIGLDGFDASKPFTIAGWFKTPLASSVIASRFESDKKGAPGWQLETPRGARVSFTLRVDAKNQLVVTTGDVFPAQKWMHIAITYNGSGLRSGLVVYVNGKAQNSGPDTSIPKDRPIKTAAPLRLGAENFKGGAINDFRIHRSQLSPDEVLLLSKWSGLRSLLASDGSKLTAEQRSDLALLYSLRFDPEYARVAGQLAALTKEQDTIRSRSAVTHIMQEKPGSMPVARVLYRGQYDLPKEEVQAGVFSMLNPLPKDAPLNRLGLAQWLVAPENPLTARVTINRFWQEVFGTGLVRSSGDFGVSGDLPSHPELLDWLAVEFRETGWDTKKFFRLMVTSATYRQSSHVTKDRLEKDPFNTYLSRGPRFRMDAEMIRDNALAVSGLLVKKIGGPSVKPYQPEGVWDAVAMRESNTRDYKQDKGENLYRRGMYTFWKRAAPPPSMDILNAPSREYCTVRRERTNTPLQALVTLNDPQFVEAARHLAQSALKKGGDDDAGRVDFMARRLLSRPFRPAEMKVVQTSLNELLAYYKAHPQDAEKLLSVGESRPDASLNAQALAAWTMLANELMNLDEVLNK